MAKQVSNVFIRLGIENFEGIEKLKSAFRELDKSIGPTSRSIDAAVAAVKSYANESTRSEQLIRGQIEAFKGLRSQVDVGGRQYTQLSSEISKLQSELRGSTDAVERQREALLRNAGAGKQNADALQRQITSLERLRQQTRPGSSAFLQLGQDIEKATAALGRFRSEVSQAASTVTQMPGASFEKVANQVAILQRRMQSLNFTSAEFLDYQRRITLINLAQSSPVGRQQVRAAAAVYEDPLYQRFVKGREEKLPLPATPAGYQQRIGEIEAELQNISNLQRRRELTLELDKLNRQLKATIIDATSAEQRAVDVVRARVNAQRELLSRSGFGAFSSDIRGRGFKAEQQRTSISDIQSAFSSIQQAREVMEASVQAAARRTVQQELSAAQRIEESDQRVHAARMERKRQEFEAEVKAFDALLQSRNIESVIEKRKRTLQGEIGIPTTRDLSPFYENVVGLGTAAPRRSQQFMGRAPQQVLGDIMYQASAGKILDPVNQDLKTFNTLSDLSTNSIGELSTALGTLKANLRPVDVGYKQLSASIERNERIIEDTLRKRENTQRQRLGGRQLAQIGGAAISGGIFGGVEGFLGGVAGGIFGGVGGSFAGAAAGAQVGMLRQQLAGTADYAAQIGKLQIALRGVSGSQANYNQALSAAAAATRELNVPQEAALQGITRLSAAVLGAGGTIGDANFAFRAISESIKATGGNAEQVDGALLALTQVFSKGKVSAEELNQIAERLPGTFTLFAQATGKTGPELQKALQQGQVGLNDLMKFLELASSKHGKTALEIAASNEEAGARLQIAYDKMRLNIGKALAPIGAEIQNTFADFITNLAPSIVDSNGNIGASFAVLVDPVQRIVDLFRELGKTKNDLQPLFDYIATNVKALTAAFYINNLVLEATIKQVVTSSAAVAALAKGDFAAVQRITTQATKSTQEAISSIPQTLDTIWNPKQTPVLADIRGTGSQNQRRQGSNFPAPTGAGSAANNAADNTKKEAKKALDALRDVLAVEEAVFKAGQALQLSRYELSKKLTDMETQNRLAALGTIERETAQALEDRRAKTMQFAEELRALEDKQLEAARALNAAQRLAAKGGDQQAVKEAQANLNLVTTQLNDLVKSKPRFMTAADVATMNALTASTKSRNEELQKTIRLETLRADLQQRGYSAAQVQLQLDIASAEDERRRSLTGVAQLDQIAKINAGYAEMVANLQKIYDLNQANANTFGFREGAQRYVESIGTMREATASLTEQGFKGLEDVIVQLTTTGTANFQAFAASILEQTARMIIQQLVLKTIMQALGAIGGGGGGGGLGNYGVNLGMGFNQIPSFPLGSALPSFAGFAGMAKGGVFAANGIVPYAMGGIVTRPTLFPFAKGGAIGTGLMGEAGPEAIIPLQRGANGKLGVAGGAGTTNITINVDASGGTTVSGDEAQAKQLGQVVTAAVQAELIKQKRPGGLFNR